MAANPEPLPPAVAALPQSVRDAMGRAWAQAVIETLNRLAMDAMDAEENAYDLERERKERQGSTSDRGLTSPPVVLADVR